MNEEINKAIARKKDAYSLWKFHGRPNDPTNNLVIEKKITTYNTCTSFGKNAV